MAWETEAAGAVNGTDELLTKLAEWLEDPLRSWSGSPGIITCDATVRGSAGVDNILICSETDAAAVNGSVNHPRWDITDAVISAARQKLWRFEKDDGVNAPVDFWFMVDIAETGSPVDFPNMGVFVLLTSDVGKTPAQFRDLYYDGHPNDTGVIADNPTAPRFSSVYPSYGADLYHFFSDGYTVHVAFRRTTIYGTSWQHFSFGSISKASAAWEGGEYFSGCCAGPSNIDCWDYSGDYGHAYGVRSGLLLSSTTRANRYEIGAYETDCCAKGVVRVVGVPDAFHPTTRTVNYCALGDPLLGMSGLVVTPNTVGTTEDAVGSAAILGGVGAYQQIKGSTSLVATAQTFPTLAAQDLCPNTWDNRAPGIGVDVLSFDYLLTSRWQLLGSVLGVRFVNMAYLNEEAVVNTDWKVFPLSTSNPANREPGGQGNTCSGTLGVAYRFQG